MGMQFSTQQMRTSRRDLPPFDCSLSPPQPPPKTPVILPQVKSSHCAANEYVDYPQRATEAVSLPDTVLASTAVSNNCSALQDNHHRLVITSPTSPALCISHVQQALITSVTASSRVQVHGRTPHSRDGGFDAGIISSQPVMLKPSSVPQKPRNAAHIRQNVHFSVICSRCRLCKCSACSVQRDLPSCWVCKKRYEVSPQKAVDVCTCFCCVQAAFYHCANDEDDECYSQPCSCSGPTCFMRWACLTGASLLMPCLCCYCPLKAVVNALTLCYNCCDGKRSCKCPSKYPEVNPAPDKLSGITESSQTSHLLGESGNSPAWIRNGDKFGGLLTTPRLNSLVAVFKMVIMMIMVFSGLVQTFLRNLCSDSGRNCCLFDECEVP